MTNAEAFKNCSLKSVMSVWRKEECGRFGPAPFGEWLECDYELDGRPKDVADKVLFEELSGMDAGECESCYLCNGIDYKSETCMCRDVDKRTSAHVVPVPKRLVFRARGFCERWKPNWALVEKDTCKKSERVQK